MKIVEQIWQSQKERTDLSAQHIELSITSDLGKIRDEARKLTSDARANARKVEDMYQKVNKENMKTKDKVEALRKQAFKLAQDAYSKAKDLGIDGPREWGDISDEVGDAARNVPVSRMGNIFSI
jgi:hypothetical protein